MLNSQNKEEFLQFKNEHKKLSKSELISMLFYFKKKLEEIERLLHIYDNANTPSSKKRFKENTEKAQEVKKDPNAKRFPGREAGHKGAGIRLPKPDRIIKHTIDKEGYRKVGKRTKTVIDFPDKPLLVTKHIIYRYLSPNGQIVEPEIDLPDGIYGKNLQSFVGLLKGTFGVSHDNISVLLKSFRPDISFCGATSLSIVDGLSTALEPVREQIISNIREALYCNADETGLRQDGQSGYVWTFCHKENIAYEYDASRAHEVPQRVLGEGYNNFVVCDGYNAYNPYKRQRCWAHLLREFKELVAEHKELERDRDYLKGLYERASAAKHKPPDVRSRTVEELDSEDELGSFINRLENKNKKAVQEFATTLKNARPYLFTGVIHPEIPLHNNHAEQSLRKVVVQRNVIGCIRNEKGERFINNILTAIQTWRQRKINIYEKLKEYAA